MYMYPTLFLRIWNISVPQIEYPLGCSGKKGNHVYFLLQVFWVILLFIQIVLLFDINVVLMLPCMVTWCTIWCQNSCAMVTINRKYTWLPFYYCPLVGILYEVLRILEVVSNMNINMSGLEHSHADHMQ